MGFTAALASIGTALGVTGSTAAPVAGGVAAGAGAAGAAAGTSAAVATAAAGGSGVLLPAVAAGAPMAGAGAGAGGLGLTSLLGPASALAGGGGGGAMGPTATAGELGGGTYTPPEILSAGQLAGAPMPNMEAKGPWGGRGGSPFDSPGAAGEAFAMEDPSVWTQAANKLGDFAPGMANAAISAGIQSLGGGGGGGGRSATAMPGNQITTPEAFGMSYQEFIKELLAKYGQKRRGGQGGGGLMGGQGPLGGGGMLG